MEDPSVIWGADFSKQREEQDLHALDHLFPRHYVPPPLAQAAAAAEFPDCARASAACANYDFSAAEKKVPGLDRVDMEAVAMLTLNDNRADSPFALVNSALCHAKKASATTDELNERDERLCRVCDYLWIVLTGLRKLPRVPRSLLYWPWATKPDMRKPVVGEWLISPGFLYVKTQWKEVKELMESGDPGGTLFVMHECWGYSVAPFSFFGHENDLLLEPGTQFRVDEVTVKDKYTVIHMYRRDSQLYLGQRMASQRNAAASAIPSQPQPAGAAAGQPPATPSSTLAGPGGLCPPEDGSQQHGPRTSYDSACSTAEGQQQCPPQTPGSASDANECGSGVAPIPGMTSSSSNSAISGSTSMEFGLASTSMAASSSQAAPSSAGGKEADHKNDANLAMLQLLCPPSRSHAIAILDKNHLFFYPDNVNSTPLATAIQTSRLERGVEVLNAAQTFIDIMGTELFPDDKNALSKVRSPLFNKFDALVLAMFTINDTVPNSTMGVINHCFSVTNQLEISAFADLLWYVLLALRKLSGDTTHSTLYRGMFFPSGTPLPSVGSTFVWSEFFYAYMDVESTVAPLNDLFPDDDSRLVVFELQGVFGYDMQPYSFFAHDNTRLVEPGLAFKVTSIESMATGPIFIHTEYVPKPLLLEHRMARYIPLIDSETSTSAEDALRQNTNPDGDRVRLRFNKKDSKEQRDADAMFKSFPPETTNLDLSSRNLAAMPRAVYMLPNLRSLQLRSNMLTAKHLAFPPGITAPLQGLQELFLYQNQLSTLPDCFSSLTNLQTLCLDRNSMRLVPPCIATMTRLRTLDLSSNKIKIIPDFFTQLCDLQILRITDNQVEALPPNFGRLTNLYSLNLKGNRLRTLPDSFGNLLRLQMLKITDNQMQSLPASFAELTQFKDLDFSHNQFEKVPDCLSQLPELKRLNFDDNKLKLKSLPPWLFTTSSLLSLRLSNNPCAAKVKGKTLPNNELVET